MRKYETDFSGKKLIIEHGKMAMQAGAAVTAQMGGTVVLATATISESARRGMGFFPLMVDFEERYFAGGEIKGPRFTKREGKPSDDAMVAARMIDRGIRPLFPQNVRNDIQVICLPLSMDYENRPDVVALLAACTALHISHIPFEGPVAGARVGMVNGDYIVNPILDELDYSDLQLIVMGDGKRITMVECEAKDLPDADVEKGFGIAMKAMAPIAKFIDDIRKDIGKEKVKVKDLDLKYDLQPPDEEVLKKLKTAAKKPLKDKLLHSPDKTKGERREIISSIKEELVQKHKKELSTSERDEEATEEYLENLLSQFFFEYVEELVSEQILEGGKRIDGRKLDQIRPMKAEVGFLPRVHGSALFSRGDTQVLSVVTIGAPGDRRTVETMEVDDEKRFFHHYNFLPYSVGEVKPIRGAGRREIGHGALAEKGIKPLLPNAEDFPYTTRVVSEVTSSNGSSSMASATASTLAIMDAGVPIRKPVAGMAMGMASKGDKWKIITDIRDLEDGPGAMDFKFTGTKDGLTAIQMDTKTHGISLDIIKATFKQTRKALNEVLDTITSTIPKPRSELSPHAPRIINFKIDPEKIGDVIGPGGKVIRAITDELDLDIDIEDDGMVMITSTDAEKAKEAERIIREITHVVEKGDVYKDAEVVKILKFGAFIKLTPSTDGFLHVSEISWDHVNKVQDRLSVGDKIDVKVTKVKDGKIDVSRKVLLPKPDRKKRGGRNKRSSKGSRRGGGGRKGGSKKGGGKKGGHKGGRKRN